MAKCVCSFANMQFQSRTAVVLFLLLRVCHLTKSQYSDIPSSPCPQLFQYKYNGNDWIGEVELPSPPIEHHEVILHITLSLRAATTPNNVGTIKIVGTPQEVTKKILAQQPLMFHVNFPFRNPIPKLVRIVYDDNLLCTGPEEQLSSNMVVSRIDLKHVMNTYTTYQPGGINNNLYNSNQPNYGNQYPSSNQPNYESGFETNYAPSTPYGMNGMNGIVPGYPSSYPNQGMPSPMMPSPAYPATQRPTFSPPSSTSRQTPPRMPPRPPPTMASQVPPRPVQTQPAFPVASSDVNTICGTRHSESEITPFIYGGEDTKPGDWPWMVAIYLNKGTSLAFNCGGTLISSKSVITAAHCINTNTKTIRADEIVLYLGRYSLIDWTEVGTVSTNVEQIIVHTDYKKQRDSYDADIAILIMTRRVEFNEFVRPACLWPGTSSIQEIEGKNGIVVGWGKNMQSTVSNIPKKVRLPIVNSITCVQTSESLSKAVSNRTFCAGALTGEGPCHGDSGGGLTLYHNDRWTLRGIVSAGLSDANTGACKLMDYVVFTDVTYFTSWITTYGQF